MQIQRDSLRFLRYAVDFFCITISFFVSLNFSHLVEVNSITLNENFLFVRETQISKTECIEICKLTESR